MYYYQYLFVKLIYYLLVLYFDRFVLILNYIIIHDSFNFWLYFIMILTVFLTRTLDFWFLFNLTMSLKEGSIFAYLFCYLCYYCKYYRIKEDSNSKLKHLYLIC